jgi:hypothetical protein
MLPSLVAHVYSYVPTYDHYLVLRTLKARKAVIFRNRQGVAAIMIVIASFSCVLASGSNGRVLRPPTRVKTVLTSTRQHLTVQTNCRRTGITYMTFASVCIVGNLPLVTFIERHSSAIRIKLLVSLIFV